MVEGGWPYIWTAYALTVGFLGGLVIVVLVRAARWDRDARRLKIDA
jgi:heme exporter protein CcmD